MLSWEKLKFIVIWLEKNLFIYIVEILKGPQEDNYLTHLGSTTNNELQERIKHTRVLTTKLGNISTNKERRTIRDELRRLEITRIRRTERERAIAYLITLKRILENKQKYLTSAYHDQNCNGINTYYICLKQLMITTKQY